MKRIILTVLQISITVFLLWWIFRDPEKNQQMAVALREAQYIWLIPGLLAVGLGCLLQTLRWRILMLAQGINMAWWRALRVYFIGLFFNLFLLGSTGGDVVKIFYAMRETATQKSAAFLSVLVDRMMGLIGMVVVAIILCSLKLDVLLAKPITQAIMGTLLLILGASVSAIFAGFIVDRFNLAHKLPHWLPMHARIIELSSAFSTYARNPKVILQTLGLSIPAHLLNFFSFFCAAQAFGVFRGLAGLLDLFSVLPAIMTIASLPISLSGIGVREKLFQNTLGELFGTSTSIAVMISMTGFLMVVFWGLVGGITYLFYRPSGGLHIQELDEEVAEVEREIENKA